MVLKLRFAYVLSIWQQFLSSHFFILLFKINRLLEEIVLAHFLSSGGEFVDVIIFSVFFLHYIFFVLF